MSNPFDEMIEELKRKEKENAQNMTLKKAIKLTNRIADTAIYPYVPNIENTKFVKAPKPTYFVGDDGRQAIKMVLKTLKKERSIIKELRRIIDLMSEQLAGIAIFDNNIEEPLILGDKEKVKKYYEEKIKK